MINPFPKLPCTVNNLILEGLIGKGGYGFVYRASSVQYQCKFAVKVFMLPENCQNQMIKMRRSFESEVSALLKLDHPNIIRLYDYFYKDGLFFLVLEYCPNGTLEDLIRNETQLSPSEKYRIALEILKGVHYCHMNNFAHRDIKTSNILFDNNGRSKIADFGLARFVSDPNQLLVTHEGTAHYVAPEIVKKMNYDPYKADIWACGVLIYRLFTGEYPFTGVCVKSLFEAIQMAIVDVQPLLAHIEIKNLVVKMLMPNPESRINLCEAVLEMEKAKIALDGKQTSEKLTLKLAKNMLINNKRRLSSTHPHNIKCYNNNLLLEKCRTKPLFFL